MKVKNNKGNKIIKFLNGKGFYIMLCVCFLAVGIATWTGIEGMKQINLAEQSSDSNTADSDFNLTLQIPSKPESSIENVSSESQNKSDTASSTDTESTDTDKTEETAAPVANFFIKPVLGDVIKDFSDTELQFSLTMQDMRLHLGIDIAADQAAPVVACGEGTVTAVYTDSMYGTVVEIDHGNGITAKYCGLNAMPTVKVGQTVDSGTQIGGIDTVPFESVEPRHLHLEFFKDGKAVSPLKYITQ